MCVNTNQYIYVVGSDPDIGQYPTVTVLNNNLPSNALVYDTAIGNNRFGQIIKWEPDTSHAGIYSITFGVDDLECPISQSNQRTIYFIVDTTLNAQCNCSQASFASYSGCLEDTARFRNNYMLHSILHKCIFYLGYFFLA